MRDKLRSLLDPTLFRFILVGLVNTAVGLLGERQTIVELY